MVNLIVALAIAAVLLPLAAVFLIPAALVLIPALAVVVVAVFVALLVLAARRPQTRAGRLPSSLPGRAVAGPSSLGSSAGPLVRAVPWTKRPSSPLVIPR